QTHMPAHVLSSTGTKRSVPCTSAAYHPLGAIVAVLMVCLTMKACSAPAMAQGVTEPGSTAAVPPAPAAHPPVAAAVPGSAPAATTQTLPEGAHGTRLAQTSDTAPGTGGTPTGPIPA